MAERFVEAFVEKLILLKEAKAAPAAARFFTPVKAEFPDVIAIQAAAKGLAKFIGLEKFTFVIAIAKQKLNTGGHIDLSTTGPEVFIEIDKNVANFPQAVWATLCHELCHKWLQVHGLPSAHIEVENEILTDITTVYLGFGKIMLNGCESERHWTEYISRGTREHTETMSVGYLKLSQLAFVYRLVCAMRNIADLDYLEGLNSKAIDAVQACNQSYGQYYDRKFQEGGTTEEIVRSFHGQITAIQLGLAELNKNVAYIKDSFCKTSEELFRSGHLKMEALRQKAGEPPSDSNVDFSLRFLRAIKKNQEVERLTAEAEALNQELGGYMATATKLSQTLSGNSARFPLPSPDMFRIVACPRDKTSLRLPLGAGKINVRCPTCKYQFAYNIDSLILSDARPKKGSTWRAKFSRIFRMRRK